VQKKLELPRTLKPPKLKKVERLVEAVEAVVAVVADRNNNLRLRAKQFFIAK
jgi:hypothetical protein